MVAMRVEVTGFHVAACGVLDPIHALRGRREEVETKFGICDSLVDLE